MEIRKRYTLTGEFLSPIIATQPLLKKGKVWIRIVRDLISNEKPLLCYVGKLVKGEYNVPNELKAFRGFVRITTVDSNETRAKENIKRYLGMEFLGHYKNEGFGKVAWLEYREESYQKIAPRLKQKKFRILKGLGTNYPDELQRLLRALMLHDFVHTEKHRSKIFREVKIDDEEIREACKNHHQPKNKGNKLQPIVKHFDRIAAYMNRKNTCKINRRYDIENGRIDFEKITREIATRQESAYKLYDYILQSEQLDRVVESFWYGKSSLKNHLLLMVNLAITSYYNKWLKANRGKIWLVKKVSKSVDGKEDEDLDAINDVEMHRITGMSNTSKKVLT